MLRTLPSLIVALALTASAAAQEYGATATVDRPIPAGSELDPTAAATTIEVDERPTPAVRTDELLAEVPGATVTRLGSYGAYTTLSLRGAGAEQTAIWLDDVPLDPEEGGAFDLSTLPPSMLDRIEVYRGGAPLLVNAGTIGGALRLVPRQAERRSLEATVGVGSYGLASIDLSASVADGPDGARWLAAAGATHADNDFTFVHPGASLDPSDDRELVRDNAGLQEGRGLVSGSVPLADGRLSFVALGYGRTGGEAGPASRPAAHAHRTLTRLTLGASYRLAGDSRADIDVPRHSVFFSAYTGYRRHRFSDRFGETGLLARQTDDQTLRVGGRAAGEWNPLSWLGAAVLFDGRYESFAPSDAFALRDVPTSRRTLGALGLELRFRAHFGDVRMELRPSARVEVSHAQIVDVRAVDSGNEREHTWLNPVGRIAAVIEPIRGLALSGSFSTGARVPSFVELFGDRGFLVGNAELDRETSVSADLGAVLRGRAGIVRGSAELRGFVLLVDDLVRYRRNSQGQSVPENIDTARIAGAELGVRGQLGRHFRLAGAATFSVPEDTSLDVSRDLPLRPRLVAFARPSLRFHELGPIDRLDVYVDARHRSASFTDPTNVAAFEARAHFGAGLAVAVLDSRLVLTAALNDAFDARGEDVLGFPLPGRTFLVTATVIDENVNDEDEP